MSGWSKAPSRRRSAAAASNPSRSAAASAARWTPAARSASAARSRRTSFTVWLSSDDLERFAGFHDALARELADAAREHGRDEGYHFEGLIEVALVLDEHARRGDLRVDAEIVGGGPGTTSTLVLPDGGRVALGDEPAVIGRMPDCAVPLSDPQVSRRHAEVRRDDFGFRVVDLGSTNGTQVNGVTVQGTVAQRRRRDRRRCNVSPVPGVVAGTCPIRSSRS